MESLQTSSTLPFCYVCYVFLLRFRIYFVISREFRASWERERILCSRTCTLRGKCPLPPSPHPSTSWLVPCLFSPKMGVVDRDKSTWEDWDVITPIPEWSLLLSAPTPYVIVGRIKMHKHFLAQINDRIKVCAVAMSRLGSNEAPAGVSSH